MCKKSFAERRAILNKIPEGIYCYTPLSYENGVYRIAPCPYWKRIGKQRANEIKGHYRIIDEDDKYILLKEEELEIPILKKDITKLELK